MSRVLTLGIDAKEYYQDISERELDFCYILEWLLNPYWFHPKFHLKKLTFAGVRMFYHIF